MMLIKALFSRRWRGGTLLVLVVMVLFGRLGIWQLDRLEERRAQNAVLQAALDSPPLNLSEPLPAPGEALENRLATVTGRYDYAQERIVLLQTWQGRTGVQLVTPLRIEGRETAVLVNRGWVPQAEYEAGQLDKYQAAEGSVSVSGFLALSRPGQAAVEAARTVYRIDIEAIEASLPYELLPVVLVDSPIDTFDSELPFRPQREIELSEGPHLSYAWQWFIFAVLTGSLYLVFVRRSEQQPVTPVEIP